MTRRKQNAPKRLKSEDGEEIVDDGQEAESVASDSTNEEQELDMTSEPDSNKMDNSQSNASLSREEESNLHKAKDKTENDCDTSVFTDTLKETSGDEKDEQKDGEKSYTPEEESDAPVEGTESVKNVLKSIDEANESKNESDSNLDAIPSKYSNRCDETKNETSDVNKSETEYSKTEVNKDILVKEHLTSQDEKKPDISGGSMFSLSGNNDTSESPISKLLNMVNNPEKLHRSSSSQAYSLAATAHTKATSLPSKLSYSSAVRASSSSPAHSAVTKSAKPLSGFLPPYNMYSHFQSMYAKMNKYLDHSAEDLFKRTKGSAPLLSPKCDSSSSLNTSPVSESDQDQPLDLSVKAKGLDLSFKVKSDEFRARDNLDMNVRNQNKYIPNSDNKIEPKSGDGSSLKSLEEKFGGNSFKMDKPCKGVKQYLPYLHPMLPMYGGTLYASALFNTHPWMQAEKPARPESSPRKNTSTSANLTGSNSNVNSRNSPPKSNHSNSDSKTVNSSKLSPTALMAKMTERDLFYHKKYTNLKCSCKKEFETLYDLTLHVKESGHTPCNRIAEQHEFPKLVRGQDMWLNHGSEQTKQILRCIRCGESFKTLPDLTVHMMKSKHYANIVGGETSRKIPPRLAFPGDSGDAEMYRCFECNEPFAGMDQFSRHLILSGHHKSPIIIQPTSPTPTPPSPESETTAGQGSSPRSKRSRTFSDSSDKDLSGRPSLSKLMEYSDFRLRYENALRKSGMFDVDKDDSSMDSFSSEENKIRCETCSEKIEMSRFVDHVRKCVKSASWDYSTPLKKRRLEYNMGERIESRSESSKNEQAQNKEHLMNGRNTPTSPMSQNFTKDSFLQPEEEKSCSNSALKAMESFIERSFTSTSMFRNSLFGNSLSRPTIQADGYPLPMSRINGHSPKSHRSGSPQSSHDQSIYSKYLPPLYVNSDLDIGNEDVSKVKVKSEENSHNNTHFEADLNVDKSNTNNSTSESDNGFSSECKESGEKNIDDKNYRNREIKLEKEEKENCVSNRSPSPSLISLQQKYLHFPDHDSSASLKESASKSPPAPEGPEAGSALASLQGLVYGKSLESKHPIDRLQKLMLPAGSPSAQDTECKTSKGESPLLALSAQSAMLKSPISMLATNNNMSAPNSPYGHSVHSASPVADSHNSEPLSPANSESDTTALKTEPNDVSTTPVSKDYGFPFCAAPYKTIDGFGNRTVRDMVKAKDNAEDSKDTLRSKHDMLKFKKQGNGKIKKAPYVYLPLDHSAKFNKYYEMANELANKTK